MNTDQSNQPDNDAGEFWCAACGRMGDHRSGGCPEQAWLRAGARVKALVPVDSPPPSL